MQENTEKKIIISIVLIISILMFIGILISTSSSSQDIKTTSGSSSSSSYSSGYTYKSKDPADYDSKGNYKPVETMTQEEKRQELLDMLEDSLY